MGEVEYVYRNGQPVARKAFGGHALDANGVCIYCSSCKDRHCCLLAQTCPNNEPGDPTLSPALVDGAVCDP